MQAPRETDTWVYPPEVFSARVNGACVCGAVRWSYDAPFTAMWFCHCSVCRRHHGTVFATSVAGPIDTFHWRAGTERIGAWQSSACARRQFCSLCGSKVPGVNQDTRQVVMPAGTLEGELGIRPQMHLYVASRLASHRIHDGLPQHAEYPPGWIPPPPAPLCPAPLAGVDSGSCACGRMRFEIDSPPFRLHHCHCGLCRRARGSAYATNVIYRLDAMRYTQGEELLVDFDLPGAQFFGTAFCRHCGGAMPRRSLKRNALVVPLGTLDREPAIHPLGHQYVASRAAWYDILDGVPQFPEAAGATAQ
jgi:hypothetical protein